MLQFRQIVVQVAGVTTMVLAIIALATSHVSAKGAHGGGHHGGGHHAGRHHGGHHGRAHHGGNHLGAAHHAGCHGHHALATHSQFGKGQSASRLVSAMPSTVPMGTPVLPTIAGRRSGRGLWIRSLPAGGIREV